MSGLNRKGEDSTTWTIITAILIILAFAGLFVWIGGGFKIFAGGSTDTEICRLSVLQKAKYKIGETQILDTDLRWPAKNLNILYSKDEKIRGEENIVAKSQDDVKKAIADEMFDCWYKFGNGQVDFSTNSDFFRLYGDQVCLVCSDIRFGKNLVASTAIGNRIDHFEDYLANTKVTGRDITYWEYFGGRLDSSSGKPEINIRLDEPQVVVYNVVKQGTFKKFFLLGGGAIAGGGVVALLSGPPGWIVAGGAAAFLVVGQAYDIQDDNSAIMSMTVVPLKDVEGKCRIL